MAAWQIQGRDAFSATSSGGNVYQAPIEIGAPNAGLQLSTPVMLGLAAVAVLVVYLMVKRR